MKVEPWFGGSLNQIRGHLHVLTQCPVLTCDLLGAPRKEVLVNPSEQSQTLSNGKGRLIRLSTVLPRWVLSAPRATIKSGTRGVALVEMSDSGQEAFCHVSFDLWALQLMDNLSATSPLPKK